MSPSGLLISGGWVLHGNGQCLPFLPILASTPPTSTVPDPQLQILLPTFCGAPPSSGPALSHPQPRRHSEPKVLQFTGVPAQKPLERWAASEAAKPCLAQSRCSAASGFSAPPRLRVKGVHGSVWAPVPGCDGAQLGDGQHILPSVSSLPDSWPLGAWSSGPSFRAQITCAMTAGAGVQGSRAGREVVGGTEAPRGSPYGEPLSTCSHGGFLRGAVHPGDLELEYEGCQPLLAPVTRGPAPFLGRD